MKAKRNATTRGGGHAPFRVSDIIRDPVVRAAFRRAEDEGGTPTLIDPRRPIAGNPGHAAEILHHILNGDVIGRGPDGHVFVLLEIESWVFGRLCRWGAEAEDMEDSHDAEPGEDDEPSIGIDVPEHDDCDLERDYRDAPPVRPSVGTTTLDPVTGQSGRWVLQPKSEGVL